jgi:hypothetical protein
MLLCHTNAGRRVNNGSAAAPLRAVGLIRFFAAFRHAAPLLRKAARRRPGTQRIVRKRSIKGSKRTIDGAKEHHQCFEAQHRSSETAPSTLQNAPSMVRKSTINASKRTIDGAKEHHQRFETQH